MGFFSSLPSVLRERELAILDRINNSAGQYDFATIISEHNGHRAEISVFKDALRIEDVRINNSAWLQQKIADSLGCILLTAKLADLRHKSADIKLKPFTKYDPTGMVMGSVEWMIGHSKRIDDALSGRSGLIDTVGKHWILDENLTKPRIPGQAVNYGWHYTGTIGGVPANLPVLYKEMPGVKMIQSRGMHHDINHSDYSQVCVLAARECLVDGEWKEIPELLKDEKLAYLINHSGVLGFDRHPGVEQDIPQ